MGNFWRLTPKFRASPSEPPIRWPATLTLKMTLQPDDYFGIESTALPRTSFATDLKVAFDQRSRKIFIERATMPEVMSYDFSGVQDTLVFEGNVVTFSMEIESRDHLQWNLKWATEDFIQSLSLHAGIFFDFESITGTIGEKVLAIDNPPDGFTLAVGWARSDARITTIAAALHLPAANNPSYRRFEIGSRYFVHALRLISQRQVNFTPSTIHSEVVLNLVKCLESVFATSSRDTFRECFGRLGLSQVEIESQLIPITLVRNELDVGHPSSGFTEEGESQVLRAFVDRSIQNVAALLQLVKARILTDPEFLKPVVVDTDNKRAKLVADLIGHLKQPPLKNPSGPLVMKVGAFRP